MSGGSWDYVYGKFENVADLLAGHGCPYRRALAKKVRYLAIAMKAVEWADSGDTDQAEAVDVIRKTLAELGGQPEWEALSVLIEDAKRIRDEIAEQLVRIDRVQDSQESEARGRAKSDKRSSPGRKSVER